MSGLLWKNDGSRSISISDGIVIARSPENLHSISIKRIPQSIANGDRNMRRLTGLERVISTTTVEFAALAVGGAVNSMVTEPSEVDDPVVGFLAVKEYKCFGIRMSGLPEKRRLPKHQYIRWDSYARSPENLHL